MSRVLLTAATLAAVLAFAATVTTTGSAEEAKPTYVGSATCQTCHFTQMKAWKKTNLAKSMKALAPTAEADDKELCDKKKAAGLDPAKDYTTDATCLACHTTGYGEPGGYPKDPKADEGGKLAKSMGSVSCEACHGPGSKYVEFKKAKKDANPDVKFTTEELAAVGLVKPVEANCRTCHNEKNPNNKTDPFKFEDSKKLVHPEKK